jgi:two-component system, chemotaxis family, chemotaxis protein CheY
MPGPDLNRLTCLVVDDSAFMRSMLMASLNALGVGKLKIAEDGGDAIEFLKLQKLEPMKAGMLAVDMIISNWQMSPVDGMILLRWVRRHADSPNRFVPFVMLSAYSSKAAITEARDAGVTEFITKPFSVAMLAAKIQTVIERPRQFVHTATYFGPDRRRHVEVFFDDERRELTDKSEGVEVIHG